MKKLILIASTVLLSISITQAQGSIGDKQNDQKQDKLQIKLQDGAKPDIYVDGKKFDFSLDILDKDRIESMFVYKGEKALEEYNAPNGAIIIKTKKKGEAGKSIADTEKKIKFNGKTPLILIDGKVSDKETLDSLSPDTIDNIQVFKGEKALEEYDAPNGAIVITTKQK